MSIAAVIETELMSVQYQQQQQQQQQMVLPNQLMEHQPPLLHQHCDHQPGVEDASVDYASVDDVQNTDGVTTTVEYEHVVCTPDTIMDPDPVPVLPPYAANVGGASTNDGGNVDAGMPTCSPVEIPTCSSADMPTCSPADMPTCSSVDMPASSTSGMPTYASADMSTYSPAAVVVPTGFTAGMPTYCPADGSTAPSTAIDDASPPLTAVETAAEAKEPAAEVTNVASPVSVFTSAIAAGGGGGGSILERALSEIFPMMQSGTKEGRTLIASGEMATAAAVFGSGVDGDSADTSAVDDDMLGAPSSSQSEWSEGELQTFYC
jgi:hypothetical protein